jgi:hypothetical protein
MVEMCCSRDGPKEDASTSDDDKEAEGSGKSRHMWQGRHVSSHGVLLLVKTAEHEEATKGPNKFLPRSARH